MSIDATVRVHSDDGVLLLADPKRRMAMSEETQYWFGVFADPDGQTQLIADFDESWTKIWRRGAYEIDKFATHGSVVVIKSFPGEYAIRIIVVEDEMLTLKSEQAAMAYLTISSGKLELSNGPHSTEAVLVDVPPGQYEATVHTLPAGRGRRQVVGVFGSDQEPALLVLLKHSEARVSVTPLLRCGSQSWPSQLSPGYFCHAEVKTIEDDVAILKLRTAKHRWSGYGRLRVFSSQRLQPGSQIIVRLVEYRGSWWWCEHESSAA